MAKEKKKKGAVPAGGKAVTKVSFKAKPKKKKLGPPTEPPPFPRLKEHYNTVVAPALKAKYGYGSPMSIPRITKVVISMGVGDANDNPRRLEVLLDDLEIIAGQRPVVTRARISVANFKLREGMPVGLMVTLRGGRLYEFLDRLISIVIPRFRDFRGLSPKAFDGRGNYAMGLQDQLVFPEIKTDKTDNMHGMNIVVCTTAQTNDEARELLRLMGFPFRDIPVTILGAKES